MKRVLAIGDITNGPAPPTTKAPRPPRTLDESGRDALTPRTAAALPRWVQNGGEWFVRWGAADTWFGLAARYLQSGKRWPEIWNLQDDRFHARVPKPEAIYVGALVRMAAEAVERAELLGDIPRGADVRPGTGGNPPAGGGPIVRGGGPSPAPAAPADDAGSVTALLLLGALGVAGLATVGVVAYRAHRHEKEARGEAGRAAARPLRHGHGGAR